MPVSATSKLTAAPCKATSRRSSPCSVNLFALESRFKRHWRKRVTSVRTVGTASGRRTRKVLPCLSAIGLTVCTT
ncbi:hypothetical protein D3C72_1745560 [compost metagenome]